jgi:hypothetical protein
MAPIKFINNFTMKTYQEVKGECPPLLSSALDGGSRSVSLSSYVFLGEGT